MANSAMIFSTTRGYMPGTNGILNAMEHYGMTHIDVYVIQVNFELDQEYKDQWPNVKFETVDQTMWHEPKNAGWYCRFAPPWRAIQLLDEYKVVNIHGADVCPLRDQTMYYDMAAKTGQIIVSTNEQGCADYSRMSVQQPYVHTWMIPYADIPCFVTRHQKAVLELVLLLHRRPDCTLSWMDALNYALRDLGQEAIALPGNLWVFNLSSQGKVRREGDKIFYQDQQMNQFHRKYWIANFCRKYLAPNSPNCGHNHLIFNQMWNFFNRDCRVKWTEGLEEWDGIHQSQSLEQDPNLSR
jgi:hypothetical protein